jgi:histidyl-tRNA synthetase
MLDTNPYKGVRDFFPKNKYALEYIKNIWKKVLNQYGYEEYDASPLEPSEIYTSKTSQEIVNEQTYTFTDRGGRSVTLRPEMTPTAVRMVTVKKRELGMPIRWFSIPNVFRYENTQRGRLREHYQLNVDLFGVAGIEGEIEIISILHDVWTAFGLDQNNFSIKINDRKIIKNYFQDNNIPEDRWADLMRVIDKKNKIDDFEEQIFKIAGKKLGFDLEPSSEVKKIMETLNATGKTNLVFDPFLMRGFDYYTGIVFEAFDKNPKNSRSLAGGGRYDNLARLFSNEDMPIVGFGLGDVTTLDVLETYGLLKEYKPQVQVYICVLNDKALSNAISLSNTLRRADINTILDASYKKISEQISKAERKGAEFVIFVGENEMLKNKYPIKCLKISKEKILDSKGIIKFVKKLTLR